MAENYAFKLIALIKKKDGLSRDEFIQYYESNHVPLILKASPTMADYRRNYVIPSSSAEKVHAADADYDVITEAWFRTKEDFIQWRRGGGDKELQERIMQDELNFLDRSSVRMFLVEEYKSDISA